ncbi:GtrA family protein [Roseateles sp. NT4]|uniref:GtrA family protein n=1 Tax=Roseateles sp. NT4 TaxID=3453715 RepID=UPI003EEAB20B
MTGRAPDESDFNAVQRFIHHLQGLPIYAAGSALALALDTGSLMLALRAGLPLALAASIGFLAGMALIYLISIRFAFHTRRLESTKQELLLFVLIGLAGLVLTTVLLSLFVRLGMPVLLAKGGTACVVFCFNFTLRKQLLFTPATAASRS